MGEFHEGHEFIDEKQNESHKYDRRVSSTSILREDELLRFNLQRLQEQVEQLG